MIFANLSSIDFSSSLIAGVADFLLLIKKRFKSLNYRIDGIVLNIIKR